MADVPITIVAGTLPAGAVYNAQTFFNAIVARMTATISQGNIIFGQMGGTQPTGPLPGGGTVPGLWFGNVTGGHYIWQSWNTDASSYLPIPVTCGQYVNGTIQTTDILCGAVTGSWKIVTPDKGGTMALLSDIPVALTTQTVSNSTDITPDWSNAAGYYIVLTGNTTIEYPANAADGQKMDYWLENQTGTTDYTVTWNGTVIWPGGTAPTQSPHLTGIRVMDHYQFQLIGNVLFGQALAQNFHIAIGSDTTPPTPTAGISATGKGNTITITFTYNMKGGALLTSDFSVIKNGNVQTVSSVTHSGKIVKVNLAASMGANAVVTIQYTGTDMKSIAGVAVAPFGPIPVAIVNFGTPSSPGGGPGQFNHFIV
jgi:hypothetical protein